MPLTPTCSDLNPFVSLLVFIFVSIPAINIKSNFCMSVYVKASLNPFNDNLSPAQSCFTSSYRVFPTPKAWHVIKYIRMLQASWITTWYTLEFYMKVRSGTTSKIPWLQKSQKAFLIRCGMEKNIRADVDYLLIFSLYFLV